MAQPEHRKSPADYARRILLAVTGLSPQVVTETLYAMAVKPGYGQTAFVPTEVHLLTTSAGARLAQAALLHPNGGQFNALLGEYPQLGAPVFSADTIHVIRDPRGNALSDIRSPADNAAAADTITAVLTRLTADSQAALHVSIAGGRKTMGFYLGYAFSLFARPQDVLSHVLVSEPFENHPDFFYPPARATRLATRDGRHVDTAEAVITLATIPVVRLRHGQPAELLQGQASFNDTVAAIQKGLNAPYLEIDMDTQRALCGDTPVQLRPALLAWLAWWATQSLNGTPEQSWRTADAEQFLRLYGRIVGRNSAAYESAQTRLADGMQKEFFEENNSKLQRQLKSQLGMAATPYLLGTVGARPKTRKFLNIPSASIRLQP